MSTHTSPPPSDPDRIRTVLCDLDGVVWLAHRPIAGAVAAIGAMRASGRRVLFVTNNSAARVADHEAALAAIGVEASGDVVSSAMAAARLVEPGEHVLVTGGPGIVEAIQARGAAATHNLGTPPTRAVDAVVVGLDRDVDYARLTVAASALHAGARLIGTNSDPTYPTPHGREPGGGAILAAIATAGERTPVIAGKPHEAMVALLTDSIPTVDGTLVVGDRPDTDGLLAQRIGCPFALVRSGVTAPQDPSPDVAVAVDVADLAAVARWLGAG